MTKPLSKRSQSATNRKHMAGECLLPNHFRSWFATRGWQPRAHQLALIEAAAARRSTLLIAPTGAGKTLAGFLPSLIELCPDKKVAKAGGVKQGLHTLYISPLKALAVDIARNLAEPIAEMELPIRIETRTGDTPASRRLRQRYNPPDILLTTPEQMALLIAAPEAETFFAGLRTIVLDELHALVTSKRGDLLALGLARLRRFAPSAIAIGLSATVARPNELSAYLMPQRAPSDAIELANLVVAPAGAKPDIAILETAAPIPWSGHSSRYAIAEIYAAIRAHRLSLVFVNTRMQAELVFQELWRINDDTLPIALHHGSLDVGQRRKVEAAMAAGTLKAVVATSTLDLGIDWGDVDLVIHVGAPKGASRLAQRIGRANHRLDEPSKAILVPSNRFEVMECQAALEAAEAGAQDTPPLRQGGLDVLAQHVLGSAATTPFDPDVLYGEVRSAAPYAHLTRADFDRVVGFVSTGGYALRNYERFAKLKPTADGRLRLAHPRLAQQYRLNVGTIVASPMIKVRLIRPRGMAKRGEARALIGGRVLGEVEEYFIEQLKPGDTFVFAGEVLRLEGLRDTEVFVSRATGEDPMIPSYEGGKFPLSTYLADLPENDNSVWRILQEVDRTTLERKSPLDDTVLWTLLLLEPMKEACDGARDRAAAVADFLEPLIDRRTRLVSVAWVSHQNGFRHDMGPIVEVAHAKGALVYTDAIQALGMFPVDVQASGVDFLCAGSYKWLLAGWGVAPFYVRAASADRLRLDRYGEMHAGQELPDHSFEIATNAKRFDYSSRAFGDVYTLGAGLAYLEKVGVARIAEHTVTGLGRYLQDGLARQGHRLFTPLGNASSIVAFYTAKSPEEVRAAFQAVKVEVTNRNGTVRISPALFNVRDDIDRCLEATKRLV